MANLKDVKQPVRTINLDGETYTLRYDFNAWAELEEKYGSMAGAIEALEKAQDLSGKTAQIIRHFLWAGMVQDAPDMTLKDVGRLLSFENLSALANIVTDAVSDSLGDASDAGE